MKKKNTAKAVAMIEAMKAVLAKFDKDTQGIMEQFNQACKQAKSKIHKASEAISRKGENPEAFLKGNLRKA